MKIAIMQPYIFPYIGYFQLVNAVDKFIFYDDVNYIKKGWINRNRLLINKEAHYITFPVLKASQNKLINEILIGFDDKWIKQFYTTLETNYKKAPYYESVITLIESILNEESKTIADLAINSIKKISNLLDITTVFELSSISYPLSKGMDKADRLIEICKQNDATDYINPSGGKVLYQKDYFKQRGIVLNFIENEITPYKQFNIEFLSGLSIIDILMFNSKQEVIKMLDLYQLK